MNDAVQERTVSMQSKATLPETGFVRLPNIIAPNGPIPVSKSTWWNGIRSGRFPRPVKLGPRTEGYPIREQRCAPAPGDEGHTLMCQYIENPSQLMDGIEREKPLRGERLNAVLSWQRQPSAAGCYCEAASREHKWGLVLETIHYALVQKERTQDTDYL